MGAHVASLGVTSRVGRKQRENKNDDRKLERVDDDDEAPSEGFGNDNSNQVIEHSQASCCKFISPKMNKTMQTTMPSWCRPVIIALLILHLQMISRNHKPSHQVHCYSPQVFSSSSPSASSASAPKSLNLNGQTQQGLSPTSAAVAPPPAEALRRNRRQPAASIEAGEPSSVEFSGNTDAAVIDLGPANGSSPTVSNHQQQEAAAAARDEEEPSRRQQPPEVVDHQAGSAAAAAASGGSKLRIVRLMAPEATQNGTQNVTLDCMFKFDKNLDQRLTIKWFFNDELEPIYQWIPELNKRVYSDKYERHLDKSYEVSDDVDYMLQSYRWLVASGGGGGGSGGSSHVASRPNSIDDPSTIPTAPASGEQQEQPIMMMKRGGQINNDNNNNGGSAEMEHEEEAEVEEDQQQQQQQQRHKQVAASDRAGRRLLAGRLSKLAKLGGRHSRQLIETLRSALHMEDLEFSRFRALRLIRPTSELNGRFTCSVSSLDGDDLRSTKLVVYEPAKSFSFNVSRLPGTSSNQQQLYNLSCQAGHVYPQPTLTLYRYRAGPLETGGSSNHHQQQQQQLTAQVAAAAQASNQRQNQLKLRRPKLAATLLRQEVLAGAQSQLSRSNSWSGDQQDKLTTSFETPEMDASLPPAHYDSNEILQPQQQQQQQQPIPAYDIVSWAIVEESSLSSNVVTQFECQLTIDGTGYEQRQSLALQRGWHVNSAALTSRHTLVGLFSALASLVCLMLALVSSLLIFRLLKRNAKNRVHQLDRKNSSSSSDGDRGGSSGSSGLGTGTGGGGLKGSSNLTGGGGGGETTRSQVATAPISRPTNTATLTNMLSKESPEINTGSTTEGYMAAACTMMPRGQQQFIGSACDSDGVYRVPESKSYGTRFVIGPGGSGGHYYGGGTNFAGMGQPPQAPRSASSFAPNNKQHYLQRQQQHSPAIITLESHIKPLYC